MKIGYTMKDLAVVPYGEVIFDLAALNEDVANEHENNSGVAVREATQDDIRTMLG